MCDLLQVMYKSEGSNGSLNEAVVYLLKSVT